ncbi:helicase associated domain-containing protein [Streptomyces exfoliatus]|uniref:helicase associated domain-containing protein n=1 Tax=Streptomyces exfoliatus TaxID=1905 RepID=UPI003F4D1B42
MGHLAPRQDAMWGKDEAMVPVGQHMANLRRKGGSGKDLERAAVHAAQLTAIDEDWNCPWPLNWQRHHRVLADLVDADGHLPAIEPGVVFKGDNIGRWLHQQRKPGTWKLLSNEQQQRLLKLGVHPAEDPTPAPTTARVAEGPSKAQAAFQRGLAALVQWVEREGDRPVPRGAVVEVEVDGETEPAPVRLGVWISNTKSRRDRLTAEQLAALAEAGHGLGKAGDSPPGHPGQPLTAPSAVNGPRASWRPGVRCCGRASADGLAGQGCNAGSVALPCCRAVLHGAL